MNKITATNLAVTFPGQGGATTALADFNLAVADGEFLVILGPSGCGKTTFLRVAAGLEKPTDGQAMIHGSYPKRPDYAMVFQQGGLFPWMTVIENIAYGMKLQGIRGRKRYQLAYEWMNRVGLGQFADAFPYQLSGGMQQRVGLARAFAHNAEVLLMDEPFAALDVQTRLVLQQTVLELWNASDATVVFVTHSIDEALTLGDRIVVMSRSPGRIIEEVIVPFERPRDPMTLRTLPAFHEAYNDIWAIMREQVGEVSA